MPTKAKEESPLASSMEVGSLGVLHLKRLWSRVVAHKAYVQDRDRPSEWVFDKMLIHGLGLALEETLQYLSRNVPTYSEFEQWVLQKNEGSIDRERIDRINSVISGTSCSNSLQRMIREIENAQSVLTADDLFFWQ